MFRPTLGTLVNGNIRLERSLGQGGMGHVWLADHLGLDIKVVVKFISDEIVRNEEVRARFSREAAAAAKVRSPHVVQTFDHGVTEDGTPFIVMEYLEGKDLGDWIEAEGHLSPDTVCEIVTQLLRALDKAHQAGIIHRDVKPNNVFLVDAGGGELFVKLLDFGIAKGASKLGAETQTGSLMGSPFYMSPEQLIGAKDLDARSDLWAVGILAFEALVGKRPFEAETIGALTMMVHGTELPKPSDHRPGIPPSFDAWFAKACAKDRATRFETARAMSESLHLALSGRVITPLHSFSGSLASSPQPVDGLSRTLNADTNTNPTSLPPKPPMASRTPLYVVGALLTVACAGGAFLALRQTPPAPPMTGVSVQSSPSFSASVLGDPSMLIPSIPPVQPSDAPLASGSTRQMTRPLGSISASAASSGHLAANKGIHSAGATAGGNPSVAAVVSTASKGTPDGKPQPTAVPLSGKPVGNEGDIR
jgi:eukaryotic-like serine/threonine-protein kinase